MAMETAAIGIWEKLQAFDPAVSFVSYPLLMYILVILARRRAGDSDEDRYKRHGYHYLIAALAVGAAWHLYAGLSGVSWAGKLGGDALISVAVSVPAVIGPQHYNLRFKMEPRLYADVVGLYRHIRHGL